MNDDTAIYNDIHIQMWWQEKAGKFARKKGHNF